MNQASETDVAQTHRPSRSRCFGLPLAGAVLILVGYTAVPTTSVSQAPQASQAKPSPTDDAALPLHGLILFGRDTGAGGKFFSIRPDGTDERFLADDVGECLMCGEWSPDRSRTMFAALTTDGRVTTATVRADGSGMLVLPIRDLTLHLAPGSWAPDGKHMVFDGWDDANPGRRGAYFGAADGSETPRLISGDSGAETGLGFSPDGLQVLTMHEGSDLTSYPHAGDLFVVAVDGSSVRQLNDRQTVVALWDRAGDPATWSPDGTSIAFSAFTNYDKGEGAVYVVGSDGMGLRRITPPGRWTPTARWSPDGKWIAYNEGKPDWNLVIVHPDGSDRQVLESTNGCCPVWSPDSRALLFQRESANGSDLFVITLADRAIRQLTHTPGGIGSPDW
jgi:Tol biopolymer transport system component